MLTNGIVAIDTETTGLNAFSGDALFMVSLCYEENGELITKYIEYKVDKQRTVSKDVLRGNITSEEIKNILINPNITKVFHNCNFDIVMLEKHYKIKVCEPIEDTLWLAHICNNIEVSYKLKHLANKYAKIDTLDESKLKKFTISARKEGKKAGYILAENIEADYWLTSIFYFREELCPTYAKLDSKRTYLLYLMYSQIIAEQPNHLAIYNLEKALGHITRDMQSRGVRVDFEQIAKSKKILTSIIDESLKELRQVTGNLNFEPSKAKDVKYLMTDVLRLPILEYTDKGNPSFKESVLHEYIDNPSVFQLLRYRASSKALQSFYIPFEILADPDGVIHPHYQQLGPKTGRYSCNTPNLQNITNPDNPKLALIESNQVRSVFVPRLGYRWYSIDYKQLELRIFAQVANEQKLLDAIAKGRDLHTEVASLIYNYEVNPRLCINQIIDSLELYSNDPSSEEVLKGWNACGKLKGTGIRDCALKWLELNKFDVIFAEAQLGKKSARNKAKIINFLQIYGGGVTALMRSLNCERDEASLVLEAYYNAIPGTKEFMDRLIENVSITGYIETLHGRKLHFDHDSAYKAVNYLIQGSAAYLLKQKMVEVTNFFKKKKLDAYIIMNIHDEIIIEINNNDCYKWVLYNLREIMQDTKQWYSVPMEVDINRITENWSKKVKVNI